LLLTFGYKDWLGLVSGQEFRQAVEDWFYAFQVPYPATVIVRTALGEALRFVADNLEE
jgi:hypothetical protein